MKIRIIFTKLVYNNNHFMRTSNLILILALAASFCSCGGKENTDTNQPVVITKKYWKESGYSDSKKYAYLSNNKVQIGVDLTAGGSIFHFSDSSKRVNQMNHYDKGRFMQQSYYAGEKDGSTWNGKDWRWNPVQGGGWDGTSSVIKSKTVTEDKIEITTEPMHWATCKLLPECEMKETISLVNNYAKIHFEFTNNGTGAIDHTAYNQELPAFFCDYDLKYFVTYEGSKPWQGDAVTVVKDVASVTDWPFTTSLATECWAAYVNSANWGIGVYTPESTGTQGLDDSGNIGKVRYSAYRASAGPSGPTGPSTSYFAPHAIKKITKGFSFSYDVYMTIGTIDEIRATFKGIHDNL